MCAQGSSNLSAWIAELIPSSLLQLSTPWTRTNLSRARAQVLVRTMCAVAGVFRLVLLEVCADDCAMEEEAGEMWAAVHKAAAVLRPYVHHEELAVCNAAVSLVQGRPPDTPCRTFAQLAAACPISTG